MGTNFRHPTNDPPPHFSVPPPTTNIPLLIPVLLVSAEPLHEAWCPIVHDMNRFWQAGDPRDHLHNGHRGSPDR